jgi:putative phosphoribosyl transferase
VKFYNRKHAGELLSKKMRHLAGQKVVVLALPRGGVPVAFEICDQMGWRLEVLLSRKITSPLQPELALGAVCENDPPVWNESLLRLFSLKSGELEELVQREKHKLQQQSLRFRSGKTISLLKGKTVILIDDGLATGATIHAAIKFVKQKKPAKIVLAVPVAAKEALEKFKSLVSEIIVIEERDDLVSIGTWYLDFSQVSDEEVVNYLVMNRSKIKSLVSQNTL